MGMMEMQILKIGTLWVEPEQKLQQLSTRYDQIPNINSIIGLLHIQSAYWMHMLSFCQDIKPVK